MSLRILVHCLCISIVLNFVLAIFLYKNSPEIRTATEYRESQHKYPLLSKRILQEFPQDILINFLDLRKDLRSQTTPFHDSFGFYFEYLPTGTSLGVNEKDEFHAASLFKIPVIMAYYHGKERMKNTQDPTLTIQKDQLDNQFGDLWKKGAGTKLKASEAINLAIKESDNTAVKAIIPLIQEEDFQSVYEGLDIDLQVDKEGALISAKNYSSILKSLYFSSVLSKNSSEEILDNLTKTKFPDKLAAGVPQDIVVAHKIGDFVDDKGNEGFRDCGIVYVPRRPYLLCMFSVGDEQTARDRMQAVSKTIYDYVASQK